MSSFSYADAMKKRREQPQQPDPRDNHDFHGDRQPQQRQRQPARNHPRGAWGRPNSRGGDDNYPPSPPSSRQQQRPGPGWGGRGRRAYDDRSDPTQSQQNRNRPQYYNDHPPPPQHQQQQRRPQSDRDSGDPSRRPSSRPLNNNNINAWGANNNRGHTDTITPSNQRQPQRQEGQRAIPSSSTWGKPTPSSAANPTASGSASSRQNSAAAAVASNTTPNKAVAESSGSSAWTTIASSNRPSVATRKQVQQPKKKAPQVQLLKKESTTTGTSHPRQPSTATTTTTTIGQNKSKKPKPKLKTMSIGDAIASSSSSTTKKAKKGPPGNNNNNDDSNNSKTQQKQQSGGKAPNLKVDSVQEFPALGAGPVTSAATDAPKPAWGVKSQAPLPPPQTKVATGNAQNSNTNNANKKKKNKATKASEPTQSAKGTSLSSFFQPLSRTSGQFLQYPQQSEDPRQLDGEEHQLLRLMQKGNVYEKKGRHRVTPRKKKFTALKKKVLQERLQKWRTLHPQEEATPSNDGRSLAADTTNPTSLSPSATTVCVYHFTSADEVEDDDEYEEILENLRNMASKIGTVNQVLVPRKEVGEEDEEYPVFVKFEKAPDAEAARACWDELVVAGTKLRVTTLDVDANDNKPWSEQVLVAESSSRHTASSTTDGATSTEIFLQKVLMQDDYEDEDCMEESLQDLKKIAEQFGHLQNIHATIEKDGNAVLTYQCNIDLAKTIADNLCRTVVGGKPLYAFVKEEGINQTNQAATTIVLDNILTDDDLEDEECLSETLGDIRELCMKYGNVSDIAARGTGVKVTYEGEAAVAENAAKELDGLILGGNVVGASVLSIDNNYVALHNVLTQDDLDDEDCLEESLNDIRTLAAKYGVISNMEILRADDTASIQIYYEGGSSPAAEAAYHLNGMVVGGQICSAVHEGSIHGLPTSDVKRGKSFDSKMSGDKRKTSDKPGSDKKARTDEKAPLYSGDKLIPERFAEMKRVPKVPNASGPRDYATSAANDERVKPLLVEMLGELMRLQKRAIEEKNAKARRRVVMGLREVARGIRANKVKMVVMANNLDQYGVIDEKLQEIIDLAKEHGVPLFFEFTKRTLGKALGKSIKIAVVGIQSADGAHQPFKKLNALSA